MNNSINQNIEFKTPLPVNLIISQDKKHGFCLQLRKTYLDTEIIKNVISCAYSETPIIAMPVFTNRVIALSRLVDTGIIYNENGNYYFTI